MCGSVLFEPGGAGTCGWEEHGFCLGWFIGDFFPLCMVIPNLFVAFSKILMPESVSSLVLKRVAQLSTYISMCIRR